MVCGTCHGRLAESEDFFFVIMLKWVARFCSEPSPVMLVSNPVLRARLDTSLSHYYTAAQSEKGARSCLSRFYRLDQRNSSGSYASATTETLFSGQNIELNGNYLYYPCAETTF